MKTAACFDTGSTDSSVHLVYSAIASGICPVVSADPTCRLNQSSSSRSRGFPTASAPRPFRALFQWKTSFARSRARAARRPASFCLI